MRMPGAGVGFSARTPPKTPISPKHGAEFGALADKNDSELAKIVRDRPTLPQKTKPKLRT